MDSAEAIPAQYQQHIEKLGLSEDEAHVVIQTLRAITANIVDDMFRAALEGDMPRQKL
jgi:hypothetical protein